MSDGAAGATRALVVVDVQRDFCEGGSLAVTGGAEVASRITEYIRTHRDQYAVVVATRDHHRDPGRHFAEEPDFRESWPRHCEIGTVGAEWHPDLDPSLLDEVFSKGESQAAYSGFEGHRDDGVDLGSFLHGRGIDAVDIAGIATDYCVLATALDARSAGFETTVLIDLAAGVSAETSAAAREEMEGAGISVTPSR